MNDTNKELKNSKRKQNNNKSGIKAKRKDIRRQEAVFRQTENIVKMEKRLDKVKNRGDLEKKIARANVVLQCIRGGTPHEKLWAALKRKSVTVLADNAKN